MRKETFKNKHTGCEYTRIDKRTALKIFCTGRTIITCANNQIPTSDWCNWGIIEYNPITAYFENPVDEFNALYNKLVYYNGKGIKFYIPTSIYNIICKKG